MYHRRGYRRGYLKDPALSLSRPYLARRVLINNNFNAAITLYRAWYTHEQ